VAFKCKVKLHTDPRFSYPGTKMEVSGQPHTWTAPPSQKQPPLEVNKTKLSQCTTRHEAVLGKWRYICMHS